MKNRVKDQEKENIEKIMETAKRWIDEDEIPTLKQVLIEYPSLKKYREQVPQQLLTHCKLIVDLVWRAHNGKLYPHSFVINGAIMRSLNYYSGAIWALATRNDYVFFDCLRAQCETLALVHYCVTNPKYVIATTKGERKHPDKELKIVNVLDLIDETDRKYKGIRKDYDSLCELVHPNPKSLYLNIQPKGEIVKGRLPVVVSTKSPRMSEDEAEKDLKTLIVWTSWIFEELSHLSEYFKKELQPN